MSAEQSSFEIPPSFDEVVEAVRGLHRDHGRLPPERQLAEKLNVKRHQLRKALDVLRRAGELEPPRLRRATREQPRYGEELVRMTNPLEVLELRLLIEPGLARLASVRASAHEISRILEAATTPENAPSGAVDFAFHFAVVSAARNHLAGELYRMLRQLGVDSRVRIAGTGGQTCPKRIAQRDAEHRAVAEAIARRDPEAAEAAMRAHLLAVQKQINERTNAAAFAA